MLLLTGGDLFYAGYVGLLSWKWRHFPPKDGAGFPWRWRLFPWKWRPFPPRARCPIFLKVGTFSPERWIHLWMFFSENGGIFPLKMELVFPGDGDFLPQKMDAYFPGNGGLFPQELEACIFLNLGAFSPSEMDAFIFLRPISLRDGCLFFRKWRPCSPLRWSCFFWRWRPFNPSGWRYFSIEIDAFLSEKEGLSPLFTI